MPQNTNLNVSPYFDDFDSEKNYTKILFKPGSPVQARELTTLQSVLQGQIEKFGKHIFKEGSVVIPGKYNYDPDYTYVKIESTFFGVPVESYYDKLIGLRIQGKQSGVTAKVVNLLSSTESLTGNTTLYIKYEGSSSDLSGDTFLDGENLITLSDFTYGTTTITADSDFASAIAASATGTGCSFKLIRGIFFARGAFIEVPTDTLILDQYTNRPSYRVGFQVTEKIVTAVDDSTLFDNAAGFSNFTAPGADRLKISLSLTKKGLTDFNDESFIELYRTDEGKVKQLVDRTVYNEIAKEFARRTFDESGDYYVRKFPIEAKECLNDRYSVFGQFLPSRLTEDGNVPSKDLMCIGVGPGKAYVKGFESYLQGYRNLDVTKPRTTKLIKDRGIPFVAGNRMRVNNVYGGAQIKLNADTADFVDLRSKRLLSNRTSLPGDSIGRARVYDFKLQNAAYADVTSVFELMLFDIQLDTVLTLNQALTLASPARIEGASSGAKGMLRTDMSNTTSMVLTDVAGTFLEDEQILINGERQGRVISSVRDYDMQDVKSVRSTGGSRTFAADVVLEEKTAYTNTFQLAANGNLTASLTSWAKLLRVGDIVSYTDVSQTDPVYLEVSAIAGTNQSATLIDSSDGAVAGVAHNAIHSSGNVTITDLKIIAGRIKNSDEGFLYADMPHRYIESVDLTDSILYIRKEYTGQTTSGDGQLTLPSLVGTDFIYSGFDEERYSVVYTDGSIEPLTSDQVVLTGGSKSGTISGLTASQSANVVVQTTQQKANVTSKVKSLVKQATLVVSGSSNINSGISTGISDGLSPSNIYGKRVQDAEVSLDVPDVVTVHAVFESSGTAGPTIPNLQMSSFTGSSGDNSDLIVGEIGVGKSSGAAAMILARDGGDKIEICSKNSNNFIPTEEIEFSQSGVRANISSVNPGDPNIRANFVLDNGQREEFYDFARLVRKPNSNAPQGQLKVYFDHYTINSEDGGDILTASSYERPEYDRVPAFGNVRNTDIIDLRPRVAPFSGSTRSPFEFESRNFASGGQSVPNVLVSDETIQFDYRHYLARKDRLYINQNNTFTIVEGTPAERPVLPDPMTDSFELAQIDYKPYVYDARYDTKITFKANRRYTMKDIGKLENRIEDLEEITSLSLLEAKTDSLTIKDPDTGLDRFKNGFVVDPFRNFDVADKTQTEIKYELDNGTLIAKQHRDSVDLLLGSNTVVGLNGAPDPTVDPRYTNDLGSPNIVKTGDVVTLAYEEIIDRSQNFATRLESVNPYMYRDWGGMMQLTPDSDVFIDRNQVTITEGEGFANDFFAQTEPQPFMREQNVQFDCTVLKPNTQHFAYWNGTDMTDDNAYTVPKLIEVTPTQGSFQIGEAVRGYMFSTQANGQGFDLRFRLAAPNHKDGPFNAPTIVYNQNPYSNTVGLSSAYSETTSVLNVDTQSLNQKSDANFFGTVTEGMVLVGESSGAQATVSDIRLITDETGCVQGCYYIPPNMFRDGDHTAAMHQVRPETLIPGKNVSTASAEFFTEGFEITETTVIRTEPALPEPVVNVITNITNNTTNNITNVTNNNITNVRNVTNVTNVQENNNDDPLAQSFVITEDPGIFMTGVDMFFQSRSETIPVKIRIVPLENGYPSVKVMKHSEVELDPEQVNISDDGSVPTRFTFPAPVYLPAGDYAFYLGSASGDYDAWISQVGEADINTLFGNQFQRVVVTKQPAQGSLFKAQSNNTWTASQLEDLKYVSYKARFTADEGSIRLYNPQLNLFGARNKLPNNPIEVFSKRVFVGFSSGMEGNPHIVEGTIMSQANNTTARGVVAEKLAHLGQAANTLSITNSGSGYEDGTYDPVTLLTVTGRGIDAVGIVTVSSGAITQVTVKGFETGEGYKVGDTLTANLGTKGLGSNLLMTVGVTTAVSGLVLTNVSGSEFDTSNNISYIPTAGAGVGIASAQADIIPNVVTINTDEYDGRHFKVNHPNHGNHSETSYVTLQGIAADSVPTRLTVGYAASVSSVVSVASSAGFNMFEGEQVSPSNLGYALIGDEIISYTSVGTNQLTGTIVRNIDDSIAMSHEIDTPVQKYELSGVSLRKINKLHSFGDVTNAIENKIGLDHYYLKHGGSNYFAKDKVGGGERGRTSANISFDTVNPNIAHSAPTGTQVTGKVRTTSGTSVDGNEASFLDQGFEDISLLGKTEFKSARIIASRDNEQQKNTILTMPGAKSFTFEATLKTENENVSPVVDVFKSSILTESNRINNPVSNYKTDRRANGTEDPHNMVYQTKEVQLENPSTSLKVLFATNRPAATDIRVLYRLKREDAADFDKVFELMPGFSNLDSDGDVLNPKNNDGKPDKKTSPSLEGQFNEYEFTANNVPAFTAFQVKLVFNSSNSAEAPKLLDFRTIAVA